MKKFKKDENGYIVVETIGSFIMFVFFMLSIISLINIVVVQARTHYAITQAANTVSMYTYALCLTGVTDGLQGMDEKSSEAIDEANTMIENVDTLFGTLDSISQDGFNSDKFDQGYESAENIVEQGKGLIEDPKGTLKLLLGYGGNEIAKQLFSLVVKPVVKNYLANGEQTADEYLRGFNVIDGVDGLKFNDIDIQNPELDNFVSESTDSKFIDKDGNITIVMSYDIDLKLGALPLPFEKLEIVQTAKTKSWLKGNGDGYEKKD